MKKQLLILLCFCISFSLFGCESDLEKTDEYAVPFVEAMLLRDEDGMKEYLHPDYIEKALPDDSFYDDLAKNHFFTEGNSLTQLTAIDKKRIEDTEIDGKLMECNYRIVSNEAYYDVNLIFLDNDNGYGIIAVSMTICLEPELYT